MASAQVLSNSAGSSRKQGHLEAGKRRLEEFRKKKAAAKKAASTSQSHTADSATYEKQASENGEAHISGAIADGKSDVAKTYGLLNHNDKSYGITLDGGLKSALSAQDAAQSHHMSFDLQKMEPKQEGKSHDISGLKPETDSVDSRQIDDQAGNVGSTGEGRYAYGIPSSSTAPVDSISYYHSKSYGAVESLSNNDITSESFQNKNSAINDVAASVYSDEDAANSLRDMAVADSVYPIVDLPAIASEPGHGQHEDWDSRSFRNNITSGLQERNIINAAGNFSSFYDRRVSEPISTGSSSHAGGSFNDLLYSAAAETHPRRPRTSFISSLFIGRDPPATDPSYSEKEKLTTSKFQSSNFVESSAMQDSFTASGAVESLQKPAFSPRNNNFGSAFKEQKLFDSLESKLESSSQKQNEDFAALEQHIEDLTQEKFSLQRALDTSKSLAESLASENSSLTESYNQQASIVAQLKTEVERLQGEIKARLVELESIKAEYMNVQLECNAADERAKLLASEVIGLEEKALRLRSNELKLERELEKSNGEIASYKKKMSSLEKERQDMLQTIDALQEEKKLLQSKLRRASAGGMSVDIHGHSKKDASTCTSDLGLDIGAADTEYSGEMSSDLQGHADADNLLLLTMHRPTGVLDSATVIPPDQVQMIQNINSLISEIMLEKEEVMQALMTERMTSTKLKDLNKELSQKLEVQTQRLELLTAQSMASENIPARQPTGPQVARETVAYADEGDEVVERVLGWIMKLFPGGPAKRKTSRL